MRIHTGEKPYEERNHVVVVYITVQEVVIRPNMFNNILAQYIPLFEGQNLYTPGSYLLWMEQ